MLMRRIKRWLMVAAAVLGLMPRAEGFALLGPFPQWQLDVYDGFNIGYDLIGDIGGPHNIGEGYRWNVPMVTYAYDLSFVNYFGSNGIAAVEEAIRIFNDLPPYALVTNDASNLYINGERVPTDTRRVNFVAQTLGLLDLKSVAMGMMMEELGLAEPERFTWTLAGRRVFAMNTITNWTVFNRNFDPITYQPSPYVNNTLYTYEILEQENPNIADAVEIPIDPLAFAFTAVAGTSGSGGLGPVGFVGAGVFFTGLTHDDIGGLRYLYSTNALYVESLLANITGGRPITGGAGGSPWGGFLNFTNLFFGNTNAIFSTNVFGTNATNLVVTGLRPGIGKVVFQRVEFDSLIGQTFTPITNRYTETIVTNGRPVIQPLQRAIFEPDFVFSAGRLGLAQNLIPFLVERTTTDGWQNNDALNGIDTEVDGGPGVINGPVQITFTDQLPYFLNTTPFFLTGGSAVRSFIWGSFDGTTNQVVVYPQSGQVSLQFIRAQLGL